MKTFMETVNKMKTKMKTNIKGIIACLPLLALFVACETQQTPSYDKATDGVLFGVYDDAISNNFDSPSVGDTTRLSFGSLPDPTVESHVFEFPYIQLQGAIADHDREINVEVAKGPVNPATRFEIVPTVMKAGEYTANLAVRVYNTDNLSERDTVTVQLADAPELRALPKFWAALNPTHTFILYKGVDQPAWWTEYYIDYYIGRYDDLKMQILMTVVGSTEDPVNTDSAKWPLLQAVLNKYCEDNDIKYPGTDEDLRFIGEYYLSL